MVNTYVMFFLAILQLGRAVVSNLEWTRTEKVVDHKRILYQ